MFSRFIYIAFVSIIAVKSFLVFTNINKKFASSKEKQKCICLVQDQDPGAWRPCFVHFLEVIWKILTKIWLEELLR